MIPSSGEDVEQVKLSLTSSQNIKWGAKLENSSDISSYIKYAVYLQQNPSFYLY